MIIKLIYKLIILMITPMSVYYVLLLNAAALPDTYGSYQIRITMHQRKFLRNNYNSFIGYLPRDSLVMTVIM